MEQRSREILDRGPRKPQGGSLTMLSMQSTSPIRRYVLLRHSGQDAAASRWSKERIAPAPRGATGAPVAAQPAKPAVERG
jgi:hypothetical protein